MKHFRSFSACLTIAAALSVPLWGQRGGGQGIGRVAGGVTGAATGTVNGAASGNSSATLGQRGQSRGQSEAVGGAVAIADNAKLSSRLQTLLPSGESVSKAAVGFENQGQFIAAVHAAYNLNIPFDQLKTAMTEIGRASCRERV